MFSPVHLLLTKWKIRKYIGWSGVFVTLAEGFGEGIAFGSLCLFIYLSAQNFRVFLRNRLSDRDKIFTIAATTHVECFNDNYDIIGHVVAAILEKQKNFRPLSLKPHHGKNLNLAQSKYSSWGMCDFF